MLQKSIAPTVSPKHGVEVWGGMECTINRVREEYIDQLYYSGHRTRNIDIDLFAGLGIKKMRYPILWEHHQPVSNSTINWSRTNAKLQALRSYNIDVIAGLVHHGSGPAHVNIMDKSFVIGLAQYAGEVAKQFPWIEYYTPVNEPLTTARFCGLYGLWYPHENNDAAFCRILVNECKATVMAMAAIRLINPIAKLVQIDDLGKVHSSMSLKYQADFENERRWLSYDLLCGKVNSDHALWNYLIGHGISIEELDFFVVHKCCPDIIGVNYYLTSERYLEEIKDNYPPHTHGGNGRQEYADVEAVRVGKIRPDGLKLLLKEAWYRYSLPLAVTEVHLYCTREEQMRWLKYVWETANELRDNNIPILAVTAWALLGSFGWDKLLTSRGGAYEQGIFDISNGTPRATILAAMMRAYSLGKAFNHPVLDSPGWWQRSCRAIYGKDDFFSPVIPSGKQLVITGIYSSEMAQICRLRCLNHIQISKPLTTYDLVDDSTWARLAVNEYLEIKCKGRPDLVIKLIGHDPYHSMNIALDLFIDGESGNWAVADDGVLSKQNPDVLQKQQFLAS